VRWSRLQGRELDLTDTDEGKHSKGQGLSPPVRATGQQTLQALVKCLCVLLETVRVGDWGSL